MWSRKRAIGDVFSWHTGAPETMKLQVLLDRHANCCLRVIIVIPSACCPLTPSLRHMDLDQKTGRRRVGHRGAGGQQSRHRSGVCSHCLFQQPHSEAVRPAGKTTPTSQPLLSAVDTVAEPQDKQQFANLHVPGGEATVVSRGLPWWSGG